MNLPKYVSKDELKKQYHKLAKMYHPDILNNDKTAKLIPED
jgi:DnaJ-class molecular chaperone